ncbi:MAG: hypothetical protein ACR2QO_29085 [Acidimicrobiales bacterium]
MASYELIDEYLVALRLRLLWRPDVDDVVAEAADHLLSAMERLTADGADGLSAQHQVLARFGDSTTVATAFATTSTGGLAVPTKFTKLAGVAAIVAALLWAGSASMWLLDQRVDPSGGAEQVVTYLAAATLVGAASLTVMAIVGLNRRHGGLGALGGIGLALAAVGMVATLLFWFVMGWGVLFAAGMLLIALAMKARRLAPSAATAAFGSAWLVGVVTWSVLRYLEVGTRDQWGDYPIVSPIAISAAVLILAPGLIGLGRWLSSETPAELDSPEPLAAT